MKHDAIVVGAGVVGVLTAEALVRRGLRVQVIDRGPCAASATSYANAGQLSFGYSGPWATPGLAWRVPGMLLDPNGPLRIAPADDWSGALYQMRWLYWFLRSTRQAAFEQNKRRILALSSFSRAMFGAVLDRLGGIDFHHKEEGTLQLFRDAGKFEHALKHDLPQLQRANVRLTVADTDACCTKEPALARVRDSIAGGLIFRDDAIGDCRMFTAAVAARLADLGVVFSYGEDVIRIDTDWRARGVTTSRGNQYLANQVVVAAASWSRDLLLPLGLSLPVAPVKGYSLTAPVISGANAPVATIIDESSKIAVTRLGPVLRAGGTAEISGFNLRANPRRAQLLARTVQTLFPGAVDLSAGGAVETWCGLRPMTPDGTAVIGKTLNAGLFTNVGHGTLGWTQAAGSAEHLARVMCGESTALDPADYELGRYGRRAQKASFYPVPAV